MAKQQDLSATSSTRTTLRVHALSRGLVRCQALHSLTFPVPILQSMHIRHSVRGSYVIRDLDYR